MLDLKLKVHHRNFLTIATCTMYKVHHINLFEYIAAALAHLLNLLAWERITAWDVFKL